MLLLLWVEGVVGRGTCGSRVVGDGSRGLYRLNPISAGCVYQENSTWWTTVVVV